MHVRTRVFMITVLVFIAWIGYAPASHAIPSLIIDGTGQLRGAKNVAVAGTDYDVTFVEGTCFALFAGCDDVTDFDFTTMTGARAATQALIATVFVDSIQGSFDTDPSLTFGCSSSTTCEIVVPYEILATVFRRVAIAENDLDDRFDAGNVFTTIQDRTDSTVFDDFVFVQFAPSTTTPNTVPEPGTIVLLSSGLLGLAGYRWQQRRREGTQIG